VQVIHPSQAATFTKAGMLVEAASNGPSSCSGNVQRSVAGYPYPTTETD
jgi:hypothetical protein